MTLGKFQLATTKDQAHRIYLKDGILAEVTLRFEAGEYVPWPWTYADYRLPLVLSFLRLARVLSGTEAVGRAGERETAKRG